MVDYISQAFALQGSGWSETLDGVLSDFFNLQNADFIKSILTPAFFPSKYSHIIQFRVPFKLMTYSM